MPHSSARWLYSLPLSSDAKAWQKIPLLVVITVKLFYIMVQSEVSG